MNDKQLTNIIKWTEDGWYAISGGDAEADKSLFAARADLAAMHTPITPDTLDEDGWVFSPEECAYWTPKLEKCTKTVWVEPEGDNAIVEVEWHLEDQHMPFPDVTTMYDLNELVRLLGGKTA